MLYLALVTLGWINLYAAVYDETVKQTIWDLSLNSGRQLLFMAACIVIIMGIVIVDMRFYEVFAYLIYGLVIALLVMVPIIGKEVGGNKSWIGIGSFGLQPSEFAKFATALAVAKYMGSVGFRMDNFRMQLVLFGIIGVPMLLILAQKDIGTLLVFSCFILVFFREGMSPFILIVGICAATIFILTLLIPNQLYLHGAIVIALIALVALGKKKFKRIAILTIGAVMIWA
jgi:rod shape determining protein RodA